MSLPYAEIVIAAALNPPSLSSEGDDLIHGCAEFLLGKQQALQAIEVGGLHAVRIVGGVKYATLRRRAITQRGYPPRYGASNSR